MSKLPSKIAIHQRLQKPDSYTEHCFRVSSATWLANMGGIVAQVKQLGDWKSEKIAMTYIRDSEKGQQEVAKLLMNSMLLQRKNNKTNQASKSISIQNCQNFTFTLNVNK